MVRYVLIALLVLMAVRAVWRLVQGIVEGASEVGPGQSAPRHGVQMLRDPVCGTFVVPDRAVSMSEGRQRVYFCSDACREKYRARTA
jgi:YHS domain-containing protein